MSPPPPPFNQAPKTDGKAIGSLVCGLLGLLCIIPVIGSILAIILGHISLSEIRSSGGAKTGSGMAITGLATGYLGLIMIPLLVIVPIIAGMTLPVLSKSREKARRVNCAGNLKQLGLACLMYSGEHQGEFPPDLATLAKTDVLYAGKVYVCPSNPNPQAPTTAEDIANGICGYDYFGKGTKDVIGEAYRTVIAADKPENHDGQWMNFLFADGHVEGCAAGSVEEACRMKGWRLPPSYSAQ